MHIIAFVVSFAIFLGGIYVMGSAFYVPGFEAAVFIAGLLLSALGIFIPIHVLKRIDG